MCIYNRSDYICGHHEWGPMKAQCTRYWRKCCIRSSHESFSSRVPKLCKPCEIAESRSLAASGPVACESKATDNADLDLATTSSLKLTLRFNPFPAASASRPTIKSLEASMNDCLKRFESEHNLCKDSIRIETLVKVSYQWPVTDEEASYGADYQSRATARSHAIQDYAMQMMLLEQQNKKRQKMRQESASRNDDLSLTAQPPLHVSASEISKLEASEIAKQTDILGRISASKSCPPCKKHNHGSVEAQACAFVETQHPCDFDKPVVDNCEHVSFDLSSREQKHARKRGPEEYEVQLQMLVMQNKKRLMMARHEQSLCPQAPEDEQIREMEGALKTHEKVTDKALVPKIENDRVEVDRDEDAWSTDELDEWSNCGDDMITVGTFQT